MSEPIRAVLFDMDGTLVRTFIDFPALRQAVADQAQQRYGAGDVILQKNDALDIIADTLAQLPATEQEDARRDLYRVLEIHEIAGCENPQVIPGARELLAYLREQGIRTAIVTRNTRSIAVDLCARMEIAVDTLIAREDTTTYKPHPEPLLIACNHLQVEPVHTVMIGDLWADVAAGKAAGCRLTMGIQWQYDPPQRFAKATPTHVVSSLQEAWEILSNQLKTKKLKKIVTNP